MALRMACPTKRTGSDNWYFRRQIPKDVKAILAELPKAKWPRNWYRDHISISLRTADRRKAKALWQLMSQGRVQAPELAGPVALQGGNVPGDTFTGAPQPVEDQNLARIADALSGFNQTLNRYGSSQAKANAKQQADMESAYANKLIMGLSPQQWNEKVADGSVLNFQNPIARGLVEKH